MSTISHKSTAKAAIRNLLAVHGKSGTLTLLNEVLSESLPTRRGRPTREEAVTRLITNILDAVIPEVIAGEEKVNSAVESPDEEG